MKFKLIPAILICTLISPAAMADENASQNGSTSGSSILYPIPKGTLRPRVPSRVYIACRYGAGVMEFSFIEGVNSMSVTVANESYQSFDIVTAEEPMMELSLPSGEYAIECLTDDGRTFTGTIVL